MNAKSTKRIASKAKSMKAPAKAIGKAAARRVTPRATVPAKAAGRAAHARRAPLAATPAAVPKSGTLLPAGRDDLFSQLDRWFERSFGALALPQMGGMVSSLLDTVGKTMGARMPRVDLVNRDADLLVRIELPGIEKEDVQIALNDHRLTVRADASREKTGERGQFFHREISSRSYARTIPLPGNVDTSRAHAQMSNGVIEVIVPKRQSASRRAVEVK